MESIQEEKANGSWGNASETQGRERMGMRFRVYHYRGSMKVLGEDQHVGV